MHENQDREDIIRDMARTLFLCAYADGVENGEIAGEEARGGEDWNDVAPQVPDPDALAEARRIADAFDARADLPEELREEAEATGGALVVAGSLHRFLSQGDRFAHCLAMQALGSGVGLDDDCYPDKLPGWVHEAVPSSGFSWADLNPERYPPPVWECPDCTELADDPAPFVYPVLESNAVASRVLADRWGRPLDRWEDGTVGVTAAVLESIRDDGDVPTCRSCGQEAVRGGGS